MKRKSASTTSVATAPTIAVRGDYGDDHEPAQHATD
jgi:hypothetical protein